MKRRRNIFVFKCKSPKTNLFLKSFYIEEKFLAREADRNRHFKKNSLSEELTRTLF